MKKVNKIFLNIVIRLFIFFLFGFLMTYVTENMRDIFGDVRHEHIYNEYGNCKNYDEHIVDEKWEWGARHYWWFWFWFLMAVLSFVNNIIYIMSENEK